MTTDLYRVLDKLRAAWLANRPEITSRCLRGDESMAPIACWLDRLGEAMAERPSIVDPTSPTLPIRPCGPFCTWPLENRGHTPCPQCAVNRALNEGQTVSEPVEHVGPFLAAKLDGKPRSQGGSVDQCDVCFYQAGRGQKACPHCGAEIGYRP